MTSLVAALKPKKIPKPHQVETELFLLANKRCYNLSDCGTGKTLPACRAIRLLFNYPAERRILVIAPLSVLPTTWADELEEHAPDVPTLWLDMSHNRAKRKAQLPGFEGVVLINPDGLMSCWHELVAWKPGLVVIDEVAGYYRNCRTTRWKSAATLISKCDPAVWGFTATPVTNSILDSFAQILLINPKMMPRKRDGSWVKFTQFRDMLCNQPYSGVYVPKPEGLQRVSDWMQPALRFRRADVMKDVKEPIRIKKKVPLTPEQDKLFKQMVAAGKAQYGSQEIKAAEAQALVTKLAQIATGSVYTADGSVVEVPYAPRFDALVDLFQEVSCTPIIVSAPFIHTIHRLEADLKKKGYRVAVIIGDTGQTVRKQIVRDFQDGQYDFLVCHPKTLSHGVTLTASSTVCWFAPLYDLEIFAQLNDRITRYGQEGQPLQVEFFSTEAEAKVYQSLHSKERLAGKFLNLFGE